MRCSSTIFSTIFSKIFSTVISTAISTVIASVTLVLLLVVLCIPAVASPVDEHHTYQPLDRSNARYQTVWSSGMIDSRKLRQDSLILLGGSLGNGDFQDPMGIPSEDGWTHVDLTINTDPAWHVDTYNCQNLDPLTIPNHAWWCGTTFPTDCSTGDFNGYGNNWREQLDWIGQVSDPGAPVSVTMNGVLNYDTEPGYDILSLQFEDGSLSQMVNLAVFEGQATNVVLNETFLLTPSQYSGSGNDEVHLRWEFRSDRGQSDADCLWPTQGAAQIDLIAVYFDQGSGPVLQGTIEDCELPTQWVVTFASGAGDFAQVWPLLSDIDLLQDNPTPQFAFIDDGVVVPGTGGYFCTTWCYGPNGMVVNPEGGLAGPDYGIINEIWSPVLEWPVGEYHGAQLTFDVYVHLPHAAVNPDFYYYWKVRSVNTGNPADLDQAGWKTDGQLYFGHLPQYLRFESDVTAYLEAGRTYAQVALGIMELDIYGGTDATPSPYFDNVLFTAYEYGGPAIAAREGHLAQDAFPEIGVIDYVSLDANSVRFDMARNISPPTHLRNDPGDTIVIDVVAVRSGSVLNDLPKLHYKMWPNPTFDSYRFYPAEDWVYGELTYTATGSIVENRYNFDLPDTGFIFPGDVIHYYIEAEDNVAGDIGRSLLPADTTGYSNFSGDPQYNGAFVMRGLPTLFSENPGHQPHILFINDNPLRGGDNEWDFALKNLGYHGGEEYDLYWVNESSAGLGNGIGGRGSVAQLTYYETILYSCGDQSIFTLSNGDFDYDAGDDVGVLDSWLSLGNKKILLTGDNLVSDLLQSGLAASAFASNWMRVSLDGTDIRPRIGNQAYPTVQAVPGNPVFFQIDQWLLLGQSQVVNQFDAVQVTGNAQRLAEFTDPMGNPGGYPYSAATLNYDNTHNASVISLPYDLAYVGNVTAAKAPTPSAARTWMLEAIMLFFGSWGSLPDGLPDLETSTVVTMAWDPVSVFTTPSGSGQPLNDCYLYGGTTIDATILVTLFDNAMGPVVNYPAEDVWLETSGGGLRICQGGSIADTDTDQNGQTTFSNTVKGGGHSDGEGTIVVVSGNALASPSMDITFNSGDINGDLKVDLCDVVNFASDYFFAYDYKSDFFWDGVINLSDIVLMTQSLSSQCPGVPAPNVPPPTLYSRLGVYFDTDATSNCLPSASPGMYGPGFVYLIATDISETEGLAGWECSIDVNGPAIVLDWGFTGEGLNFSQDESFIMGLNSPLPWQQTIILMDMTLFITNDTEPVTFDVLPAVPPTSGPYPAYAPPGEICNTTPIWPSCSSGPAAVINGPCPEAGMEVLPSLLEFELSPGSSESQALTIVDTGTIGGSVDNLLWEIPAPDCSWVTATPANGTITSSGGTEEVIIEVDSDGLSPGFYECEMTIYSNACHLPITIITVQFTVTETGLDEVVLPKQFALHANYPNPFNPATTIRFDLPRSERVELNIYDMAGGLVRELVNQESVAAGQHEIIWNGQDDSGRPVATGVYICRIRAGDFEQTQRMVLIK